MPKIEWFNAHSCQGQASFVGEWTGLLISISKSDEKTHTILELKREVLKDLSATNFGKLIEEGLDTFFDSLQVGADTRVRVFVQPTILKAIEPWISWLNGVVSAVDIKTCDFGDQRREVRIELDSGRCWSRPMVATKAREKPVKKRLLIIEDSKSIRNLIKKSLEGLDGIEIVGEVESVANAVEFYQKQLPEFVTLDMKLVDGYGTEFLRAIQKHKHFASTTIVLITDCSPTEGNYVMDAMSLGVSEYMQKPDPKSLVDFRQNLVTLFQSVFNRKTYFLASDGKTPQAKPIAENLKLKIARKSENVDVIAIGSSTGGTEVIKYLLEKLPKDSPPILVVQHMPENFTNLFAQRLSKQTGRETLEVRSDTLIERGKAYLAAGGTHLKLMRRSNQFFVISEKSQPVNRFMPSVSVLFQSLLDVRVAANSISVMLTGMGSDGAVEMKKLRDLDGVTLGQSEETCAVFGMPRAARELDALDLLGSPEEIVSIMTTQLQQVDLKKRPKVS